MDSFFLRKGLHFFELSSGRLAWWPTAAHATLRCGDQQYFGRLVTDSILKDSFPIIAAS